jgi:hypothetical protein
MLSKQSEDCIGFWISEQYYMYQNMNGLNLKHVKCKVWI